MRKTVSLLLALMLCLPLALAACGHSHKWDSAWSHDRDHHWHACTEKDCDEYVGIEAHSFDAGVVTTPATRGESGIKRHTCTVCGATADLPYTLKTTVSAGEFAAAFDLGANFTATVTQSFGEEAADQRLTRNGNLLCYEQYEDGAWQAISYLSLEGDTCYQYNASYGAEGIAGYSKIPRDDITPATFDESVSSFVLPAALCSFSLYSYNASTKTYQAAEVTLSNGTALSGISLAFTEGRLVAAAYTLPQGQETIQVLLLITYGTAPAITPPTNLV